MLAACLLTTSFQNSILNVVTIPGNVNFDPLSLAATDLTLNVLKKGTRKPLDILYDYREAEVKHGRLAMLAAVAYPVQEAVNPVLSKALNLPNELANQNLSPSLVNGNLDPAAVLFFVGLASGLELYKMNNVETGVPADYGWRLTDVSDETGEFFNLQSGEIWNGRIAMVATLGYVVQEAVTKMPVLLS